MVQEMGRPKIHIQSKKQRTDAKTTNLDKRPKIGIKCENTFDIGNKL